VGFSRLSIIAAAGLTLVACGGPKSERELIPMGNPARIRIVNLTSGPISGKIGPTPNYTVANVAPMDMSSSYNVSPLKEYTVTIGGQSVTAKTAPGQFLTVVAKPGSFSSFNSGKSASDPAKAMVDFVNLTDKEVTFHGPNGDQKVKPNDSVTIAVAAGSLQVSADTSQPVSLAPGNAQVWAVFAVSQGGTVTVRAKSLKGSGGAVGTGGPSAA